jgi:hypothetical protein
LGDYLVSKSTLEAVSFHWICTKVLEIKTTTRCNKISTFDKKATKAQPKPAKYFDKQGKSKKNSDDINFKTAFQ